LNSAIEESNKGDELFNPIDRDIGRNAYKIHVQRKAAEMKDRFEGIKQTMEKMREVVAEGKLGLAESRRNGEELSDGDEARFGRYYKGMDRIPNNEAHHGQFIRQSCESGKCDDCHSIKRRM
jgi:hypothetical protein